jgi:hypothetical protein
MGEVKKSIRELSHEFPLAADALRLLTNPVGGALAIGIGMFTYAKEKLDEWNKSLDEQAEVLRKPDFAEAIKARKDVLESAEVSAAQYIDKMAHLIDPEEHYQKVIQSQIALLQARNAAMNTVADATNGLDEAKLKQSNDLAQAALKAQLEAGVISEEKYNAEKLRLDAKYFDDLTQLEIAHEQEKLAREKELRQEEIALEAAALERAKANQSGDAAKAKSARDKATAAAADVATGQGNIDDAIGKRDERDKAVQDAEAAIKNGKWGGLVGRFDSPDDLRKAVQERANRKKVFGAPSFDDGSLGEMQQTLDNYDRAVTAQQSGQRIIAGRPDLAVQKVDAALAQAAAERAEAANEANAKRIQEGEAALQQKKDLANIANNAGDKVGAAKTETERIKEREELEKLNVGGGYTGAHLGNVAALERIKALGGPLNDGLRKQIDAFEQFGQSVGANVNELTQLMFTTVGTMTTQAQQIAALRKELELLTKRQADLPNK